MTQVRDGHRPEHPAPIPGCKWCGLIAEFKHYLDRDERTR